jgi:hypothetical protein
LSTAHATAVDSCMQHCSHTHSPSLCISVTLLSWIQRCIEIFQHTWSCHLHQRMPLTLRCVGQGPPLPAHTLHSSAGHAGTPPPPDLGWVGCCCTRHPTCALCAQHDASLHPGTQQCLQLFEPCPQPGLPRVESNLG